MWLALCFLHTCILPLCDLISGSSHTFSDVKKSTICLGIIFSKAQSACIVCCVAEWCVALKCVGDWNSVKLFWKTDKHVPKPVRIT